VIAQRRDRRGFGRVHVWVCSALASATATRTGSSHYTRHRRHRIRHSVWRGFTTSVVLTRLNLAQGAVPQVVAWAMACDPDTSSEIAERESGERTCLHVRPGRLTMLEYRFNKTRHHPKSPLHHGTGGDNYSAFVPARPQTRYTGDQTARQAASPPTNGESGAWIAGLDQAFSTVPGPAMNLMTVSLILLK
jgi:hypothetical protein